MRVDVGAAAAAAAGAVGCAGANVGSAASQVPLGSVVSMNFVHRCTHTDKRHELQLQP